MPKKKRPTFMERLLRNANKRIARIGGYGHQKRQEGKHD